MGNRLIGTGIFRNLRPFSLRSSLTDRAARNFARLLKVARIWKYKRLSENACEGNPELVQPALFCGFGRISFGQRVFIGNSASPGFYSGYSLIDARLPSAEVLIGDGVWINNNFTVLCNSSRISIGCDVLIGYNVEVIDSDFHDLRPDKRKQPYDSGAAVHISDNVLIGSNTRILKGVTIGANSVVGNGSIVSRDIPENAIAAGCPARVIRMLGAE